MVHLCGMKHLFAFMLIASPAFADTCPAVMDQSALQAELLEQIQTAETEAVARPLSNAMWEIWIKAPDSAAQELLDTGTERLRIADFDAAIAAFDALVAYCPDYAEGYNQRAYAHFLRKDFAPALTDLDLAIERNPVHVAAIAGKALTLMGLGRDQEAQDVLREAVALNPWLSERHLLKGTDL